MKKSIIHNKLVRDYIPEIIQKSGKNPIYETLNETSYINELNKKLDEELAEYQESGTVEELADICEVIRAILLAKGISWEEFELIRTNKAQQRGGFEKRFYLKEVIEG